MTYLRALHLAIQIYQRLLLHAFNPPGNVQIWAKRGEMQISVGAPAHARMRLMEAVSPDETWRFRGCRPHGCAVGAPRHYSAALVVTRLGSAFRRQPSISPGAPARRPASSRCSRSFATVRDSGFSRTGSGGIAGSVSDGYGKRLGGCDQYGAGHEYPARIALQVFNWPDHKLISRPLCPRLTLVHVTWTIAKNEHRF